MENFWWENQKKIRKFSEKSGKLSKNSEKFLETSKSRRQN